MVAVGFAYALAVLHLLNGLCCTPILYACFKRLTLSGKAINPIFWGVSILTFVIFVIHFLQFTTIMVIVPGKATLGVYTFGDWTGLVSQGWCAFDAYSTLIFSLTLMMLGVLMTYLPFAIFVSANHAIKMPLLDMAQNKMMIIFALCAFGPPIFLAILYVAITSSQNPLLQNLTLSDWHCSLNYRNIWFESILVCLEITSGFLTAGMAFYSVYTMRIFRKETLLCLGKSQIPEDMIMRSFLLGSSAMLFDLIFAVDSILNLLNPTIGIYNGVPYILMILLSTLGSFSLTLWGSTQDLIPFMPTFLQATMVDLQAQMKSLLQLTDAESVKSATANASKGNTVQSATITEGVVFHQIAIKSE